MADEPPAALVALLGRLEVILNQPLDFQATDTESTLRKVRLLVAAATYFNVLSVTDYGGRLGPVREPGLVEQAVGAAFQTFGDVDPHPDHFEKAAMLLHGITQGHPFNDGNKRTGFLTAAYYLRLVGFPTPSLLDEDTVVAFCLAVSAGVLRDVNSIAATLRQLW